MIFLYEVFKFLRSYDWPNTTWSDESSAVWVIKLELFTLNSEVWSSRLIWKLSYEVTLICARLHSFLRKYKTGELQITLIQMDDFQRKKLKGGLIFSGCDSAVVTSNNRGFFSRLTVIKDKYD